ncbi:MAG TPA: c-type cytochrome [Burkholderiaceae bacterium]|nr:c-type cytochrome [Burkholderiaceae bacterium]
MKKILFASMLLLAALGSGCTSPERSRALGDPNVSGKTIALQVCSNCHGVGGISVSPNFPNLAAQQETYFVAQLKSFRSHNRSDPAGFEYMWGLSAHLTDEQIRDLAAYYAAQQPAAGAPANAARIHEGQAIFEKGVEANNVPACASCHGQKAEGNQQFPRLAGQHADYLVKQLTIFQRTEQRPGGEIMKGVAHSLTPENMENVAAYLQALPLK